MRLNPFLSKLLLSLFIFAAAFNLYVHSLNFDYTYMDDNILVTNAASVHKKDYLKYIFREDPFGGKAGDCFFYRPALNLSFLIDGYFHGDDIFFYHLTNVLLHSLFCALFFLFLVWSGVNVIPAFAGAVFFALIPALSAAVAWIPGRNDIILALFSLGALWSASGWIKSGGAALGALASLMFTCAMFTKETAVFIPFAVVFMFLYSGKSRLRSLLSCSAAFVPSCLLYLLARHFSEASSPGFSEIVFKRILFLPAFSNMWFLPVSSPSAAHVAAGTFLAGLLAFAMLRFSGKSVGRVLFGLLWFYASLLPPMLGREIYFDQSFFLMHRFYLPLAGLVFAAVSVPAVAGVNFRKLFPAAAAAMLTAAMACSAFIGSMYFKDGWIFQPRRIYAEDPASYRNYLGLGKFYALKQSYFLAERYLEKALLFDKNAGTESRLYLADIYTVNGKYGKARRMFADILKRDPGSEFARIGLGRLEGKKDLERKS